MEGGSMGGFCAAKGNQCDASKVIQALLILTQCEKCFAGLAGPSQREEKLLTDEQLEDFEKFINISRPMAPDNWMKSEMAMHKFFTAAEKKFEPAKALFKESLKLRLDSEMYRLSEEDKEIIRNIAPIEFLQDKFGRELAFIAAKRLNYTAALKDDALLAKILPGAWWLFDEAANRIFSKVENKKCVGASVIIDMHGIDVNQFFSTKPLELMKTFATEVEKRFPRIVQIVIIVNAPPSIEIPVEILKGTMSEYSRKVFRLYGEDDSLWEKDVSTLTDVDAFPFLFRKSKRPFAELLANGKAKGTQFLDEELKEEKGKGWKKKRKNGEEEYDLDDKFLGKS